MPRDLPLANGSLLVAFDSAYQLRDLYWPHVGQENHALGHPFRLGFWVDGQFRWQDDDRWQRRLLYQEGTLVTDVQLVHPDLALDVSIQDAVDFHENLLMRRFVLKNLSGQAREARLFLHHDFHIMGHEVGDSAYFEPKRRALCHYKGARWFLLNGAILLEEGEDGRAWDIPADTAPGLIPGLHQWACGLKEVRELQGTWRDAEDGVLSGNNVAHGSVDSCVGFTVRIPPGSSRTVYFWIAVGSDFDTVVRINRNIRRRGPQLFLDRTASYWKLWLSRHLPDFGQLPEPVRRQYMISLLVIRTQIDNGGAIIAANDTDIASMVRDTYSYMWPRDGSLVAHALNQAGYIDLPRAFYQFVAQLLTREGYLLHKFNPDGTLASSWHPWARGGKEELPIQEDETALVIWALGFHFERFSDVEFIKPLYRKLIVPAADFLAAFRDPESGLPLPSYDLWEEQRGVMAWTVATVWAGLISAAKFAEAFGETPRAALYREAAAQIKMGVESHMWDKDKNCFAKKITRLPDGRWQMDKTIDASIVGLWHFGMFPADHEGIRMTMEAIIHKLWVKTSVGGLARYEDDHYQQQSDDVERVPGNPWFVCTLWLAKWYAAVARTPEDLEKSLELLQWVSQHALPSGILAEQVHPLSNAPLSVSPLTWSHAAFVSTVQEYLASAKGIGLETAKKNGLKR